MKKHARRLAFDALRRADREKIFAGDALRDVFADAAPDAREKALAAAIVSSVSERLITIDHQLSLYLDRPVGKLQPQILTILRMGICQLFFLDGVPSFSAVNESVKLAGEVGVSYAKGLINAVLRKASAAGLCYPDGKKDPDGFLSVRYSFSKDIIAILKDYLGDAGALSFMESAFGSRELRCVLNTVKCSSDELSSLLATDNASAVFDDSGETFVLSSPIAVNELKAFRDGCFFVQDKASFLCCAALGAQPGDTVLDACAAPGGKSFSTAVRMKDSGHIYSCDVIEKRAVKISEGAERLGFKSVEALVRDASDPSLFFPDCDRVLCDVPCSGIGVASRKPEIRYKTSADIAHLPEIQFSILSNVSRSVKRGGRLVYSTCTLNRAENEAVADRFLNSAGDFEPSPVLPEMFGDRSSVVLTPDAYGCDGFFIASFIRK